MTNRDDGKMNKKNVRRCFLNIVFPLLAGFVFYYLFCPDVFMVEKIDTILKIKYHVKIPNTNLIIRFFRFYLLDALWAYALIHCLFIILGNTLVALKESIAISIIISVVMELAQLFHVAAGTFDVCDIIVEMSAIFIASIIIIHQLKGEKDNEKQST